MVWLGGLDVWEVAAHQCLGPAWLEEAGRQDRLAAMVLKGVSRPAGRTDWLPGLARAQGQLGVWAASSFWLPVGLLGWKNNHAIQICLPICPRLDYADIWPDWHIPSIYFLFFFFFFLFAWSGFSNSKLISLHQKAKQNKTLPKPNPVVCTECSSSVTASHAPRSLWLLVPADASYLPISL